MIYGISRASSSRGTQLGSSILRPGTARPKVAKHIAMRWSWYVAMRACPGAASFSIGSTSKVSPDSMTRKWHLRTASTRQAQVVEPSISLGKRAMNSSSPKRMRSCAKLIWYRYGQAYHKSIWHKLPRYLYKCIAFWVHIYVKTSWHDRRTPQSSS